MTSNKEKCLVFQAVNKIHVSEVTEKFSEVDHAGSDACNGFRRRQLPVVHSHKDAALHNRITWADAACACFTLTLPSAAVLQ